MHFAAKHAAADVPVLFAGDLAAAVFAGITPPKNCTVAP
jgi:hypothetical protein